MDDMKKGESIAKDGVMNKDMMTMQQCKDHMIMSNMKGMEKDNVMIMKDTVCADMLKNGMGKHGKSKKNDSMMKPDGMASQPMSK